MRAYHLAAFLALGFWQIAPTRSTVERFRFAVAGANGEWEDYVPASFDCNGNQTSPAQSSPVAASSFGARADAIFNDGTSRVTLVAGKSTSGGSAVGRRSFWGLEAAVEGARFGASVGARRAGDVLLPSYPGAPAGPAKVGFSLRGGRLDAMHYRVEFRPLSETPSLAGEVRTGVAFAQAGPRRVSGYVGLVLGSLQSSDNVRPAAFGDFAIPLGTALDLLVRGVFGPGHQTPNWGLGVGLRAVR